MTEQQRQDKWLDPAVYVYVGREYSYKGQPVRVLEIIGGLDPDGQQVVNRNRRGVELRAERMTVVLGEELLIEIDDLGPEWK